LADHFFGIALQISTPLRLSPEKLQRQEPVWVRNLPAIFTSNDPSGKMQRPFEDRFSSVGA